MSAKIIDGKAIAADLRASVKTATGRFRYQRERDQAYIALGQFALGGALGQHFCTQKM